MVALDIADECVKHFLCNVVDAVVIISVFREVTLHLEVYSDSVLIADRLYLCVLDGRQGESATTEKPAIPVANQRRTFLS